MGVLAVVAAWLWLSAYRVLPDAYTPSWWLAVIAFGLSTFVVQAAWEELKKQRK